MKIGDKVKIIPYIFNLQNHPKVATITAIDGGYVLIKPKGKRWECECYPEELKIITKKEFTNAK